MLILVVTLVGCTSTSKTFKERPRARPTRVLKDCKILKARVDAREKFFTSLRGQARISSATDSTELDLALMSPAYLRAEVTGPLGIRLGLIQINGDWVQFYDARKRVVHRLPYAEFAKNSERRERFLRILPVQIPGPFFLDLALSRTGLAESQDEKSLRSCAYIESENVYRLLFVARSEIKSHNRWHRVDVDPTVFFPLRHLTRVTGTSELLDDKDDSWANPEWELLYSQLYGEGYSTLPMLLTVSSRAELLWSFEWVQAEPIKDRGPEIFQWRPSASTSVQDY